MIRCLFRMLVWGTILGVGTACQAVLSNPTQFSATMTPQFIPPETTIPTLINPNNTPPAGPPAPNSPTVTPEPALFIRETAQDRLNADIAQKAQADLAARLGLKTVEVQVLSVETQEMPVQDLGCQVVMPSPTKGGAIPDPSPQPVVPGIVIGQVIRLNAGVQLFEYHALGKRLVFCGSLPGGS